MRISDWSSDVCSSDLDLLSDVLGGARGLGGKRLDLAGDDRKALAGVARTRRLDGSVERQQVGLLGDGVDELDHRADLLDGVGKRGDLILRSEEHTSELQSLMRISYAVFCLKKKKPINMIHN